MDPNDFTDEYAQTTGAKFKEWDEANKRLKQTPPKDGRAYLKHARNILPLFESIAELNPIAKAVVFSFKAVVAFESDRVENDVRVRAMLLAQTDMMRAVLQISILISEGGEEMIDSNETLTELLERIRDDIKESGNILDAYSKESKLVRFVKALEWKEEILRITGAFIEHRDNLQTFLAIRTARTVDDLHAKLNVFIKQLFTPQQEWEKRLRTKLQHTSVDEWIDDKAKVHELLLLTDDPAAHDLFPEEGEAQSDIQAAEKRYQTFVISLKDQLLTSLPELLDRNMDLFEKKLNFHTQELKDAIASSADTIIRHLEGPYDRLVHPDLKRLWKEMSWIFCVEDRLFTISLYEYYLDYFNSKFTLPAIGSDEEPRELTQAEKTERQRDNWTLWYLSQHSDKINEAVDHDRSGFIRISEVNAFTNQIPSGWTLPQWCAYVAVGWQYEQHIYQKRLQVLFAKLVQTQPKILAQNQYFFRLYSQDYDLPFNLSRQRDMLDFSYLPEGFKRQIHEKVTAQDAKMRGLWKDFKYTMGDRNTVTMLYQGKQLDSYILQLCMIIMEHFLDIAHICQTQTVDLRDWVALEHALDGLVALSKQHLSGVVAKLQAKFNGNIIEALKVYKGGLWDIYYQENILDGDVQWTTEETAARMVCTDFSSDEFPFPELPSTTEGVLLHPTWEQYVEAQGLDPEEYSEAPSVWGVSEEDSQSYPSREMAAFPGPHINTQCNICKVYPIQDYVYHCIDCEDFDLCPSCFAVPLEDLDQEAVGTHVHVHAMLKEALDFTPPYNKWMSALATFGRDVFSNNLLDRHGEQVEGVSANLTCTKCNEEIASNPVFVCLYSRCIEKDMNFCADCEAAGTGLEPEDGEEEEGGPADFKHESWHSLLILHREVLEVAPQTSDTATTAMLAAAPAPAPAPAAQALERMGGLETRMAGLEMRLAGVEQRLEEMMNLLLERLG